MAGGLLGKEGTHSRQWTYTSGSRDEAAFGAPFRQWEYKMCTGK